MARDPIPTHAFALVLVRRGPRVLLVHERRHGQAWFLPAGRVEPGETFAEAALRETREESGLDVVLEGILRIEHQPGPVGQRLRVFFLARPADDTPPRSVPDEHSLEARFVTLEELSALPLRSGEVTAWARHVLEGGPAYPLTLLAAEGAPLRPSP